MTPNSALVVVSLGEHSFTQTAHRYDVPGMWWLLDRNKWGKNVFLGFETKMNKKEVEKMILKNNMISPRNCRIELEYATGQFGCSDTITVPNSGC
jgi:hypothetical protein